MGLDRFHAERRPALVDAATAATPGSTGGHRAAARRIAGPIDEDRAARARLGAPPTAGPFLLRRAG